MATASQLLKPRRFYGSHAPRATAATPAASTTTATPRHRHCNSNCRREQPFACCRATDFHQSLLTATARDPAVAAPLSAVAVREAEADEELQAASWLRALSFYRYPEERKFAAQVGRGWHSPFSLHVPNLPFCVPWPHHLSTSHAHRPSIARPHRCTATWWLRRSTRSSRWRRLTAS